MRHRDLTDVVQRQPVHQGPERRPVHRRAVHEQTHSIIPEAQALLPQQTEQRPKLGLLRLLRAGVAEQLDAACQLRGQGLRGWHRTGNLGPAPRHGQRCFHHRVGSDRYSVMLVTSLLCAAALVAQDTLSPVARRVLADVRYLADDAREGRGVGTKGIEEAARYIADGFARAGLKPAGADRAFFQPFTISADAPAVLHTKLGGTATKNVVGLLPGRSRALSGEVIVVGAHYDHLGYGGFGALDPDSTGRVHNGADDNASGVAALLEVARVLRGRHPARTIVFIAFSGEELGDLGSDYFVKHPLVEPVDSIYAMLNMDMVGRLRDERLAALGAATAKEFPALLDSLNQTEARRFDLNASGDGWQATDVASFFAVKRPVLQFFTGLHEDYHRSTDDWEKINATGLARVAAFVAEVAWTLANRPGPLTFVDAAPPASATAGSGYGAYLGTIPDMAGTPGGVRLTGVRAASPAERAGLQGGDIITAIGTKVVANLYDMTDALRSHQPGDTVVIAVKRGDQTVQITAVLGKRGS
ncbi:MAG: peptidase M28 [Gemmatimonadetes bacterium]|nr:MAG: peptidase M28 [Gemmatimonadota bacterium]